MNVPVSSVLPLARDRKDRTSAAYQKHKEKLALSVRSEGLLNKLKVIREGDRYRLVSGQTRFDILLEHGHTEVPVELLPDGLTAVDRLKLEVAENNLTLGFDLLAQCQMVSELMAAMNCTAAELCRQVPGLSEASVSKYLAVHTRLEPEFKPLLAEGTMSFRVAYALTLLEPGQRAAAWEEVKYMKAEAAEARIRLKLGKRPVKGRKLKIVIPGLSVVLTATGIEQMGAALDKLHTAFQKLKRLNLPPENLPGLIG